MKALLHWVQDFYRISGDPTIVDLKEVMFIQHLDISPYRVGTRKNIIDQLTQKLSNIFRVH